METNIIQSVTIKDLFNQISTLNQKIIKNTELIDFLEESTDYEKVLKEIVNDHNTIKVLRYKIQKANMTNEINYNNETLIVAELINRKERLIFELNLKKTTIEKLNKNKNSKLFIKLNESTFNLMKEIGNMNRVLDQFNSTMHLS